MEEAKKWLELWDGLDVDELSPEIIGGIFAIRRLLATNERLLDKYLRLCDTYASLLEQNEMLGARLLAHEENEGDECPLCAVEADRDALVAYVRAFHNVEITIKSIALPPEITLENDEAKQEAYQALSEELKELIDDA